MNSLETDTTARAIMPTPREVYEQSCSANPDAELCVEAVARHVVTPQRNAEGRHGNVTQDKTAYEKLFERSTRLVSRTISPMVTGFERPHKKEAR
jgi:hypothetical protein